MNWDNSEGVCAQEHYLAVNSRGERALFPQTFASETLYSQCHYRHSYLCIRECSQYKTVLLIFTKFDSVRFSEVAAIKVFVLLDYLQSDSVLGHKPLQNCPSSWNQPSVWSINPLREKFRQTKFYLLKNVPRATHLTGSSELLNTIQQPIVISSKLCRIIKLTLFSIAFVKILFHFEN